MEIGSAAAAAAVAVAKLESAKSRAVGCFFSTARRRVEAVAGLAEIETVDADIWGEIQKKTLEIEREFGEEMWRDVET